MPLGLDQRVGALVWSPLGWGRLTGKLRRGEPLPEVSRLHKTSAQRSAGGGRVSISKSSTRSTRSAAETGKTVPQVALNWLLQRPDGFIVDHRRAQRGAAAPESRRGGLEPDRGASCRSR